MDKDRIIISLTSYPMRIHCVYRVIESLLNQTLDKSLYHIVLVLCSDEFKNGINDLPMDLRGLIDNGEIEIIWHPTNILSHKKLIPTLLKYPNNPILIVDDDTVRPNNWLEVFYNDHDKYPNDIIVGTFSRSFLGDLSIGVLQGKKCQKASYMNNVPGIVFNFTKPANGLGGVLYPSGTFQDKRFFDEALFMKLSPTSDESWQYCFNIMENRTMRQTSKIFDSSEGFIEGTQQMPTALHRINNYDEINKRLFDYFPEFKERLLERQNKVIVSMTSYKNRLLSGATEKALRSIFKQSLQPSKIVLTLDNGDERYLTNWIKEQINNGKIELLLSDIKIKPHHKYFDVMKKYRDYAIITVDDDYIYPSNTVKELVESYVKFPNCVSARRVHRINVNANKQVTPYGQWIQDYSGLTQQPSEMLFATGCGGVLYPPDILNVSDDNIPEIREYMNVDDIYLKLLEQRKLVKVVRCNTNQRYAVEVSDSQTQENALYKSNVWKSENDNYIQNIHVQNIESLPNNRHIKKKVISRMTKYNKFNSFKVYL